MDQSLNSNNVRFEGQQLISSVTIKTLTLINKDTDGIKQDVEEFPDRIHIPRFYNNFCTNEET